MSPINDVTLASARTVETVNDERQEIRRLAQEFEALLMTQMLRGMRRAMLDENEQEAGLGGSALLDTGDVELGRALSRVGGMGLADTLLGAFERQIAPSSGRAEGPSLPAVDVELPAIGLERPAAGLATSLTDPAPISSAFGWRKDPLTGVGRFHKGIDIAVAYGADVRAAAAGRVTFAGVQNGYGNTVVIDHGANRQTRYAHLSEQAVRQGDVVAEGQIIGRSGSSGRSTGPHLHFELLVDGRPVDPTAADD